MRRTASFVWLLALGLGVFVACGDHPREPTLPSVDFRPVLVIEVDEMGFRVVPGERRRDGVVVDPPTVPTGSVINVVNVGDGVQRVQGDAGEVFDTGILMAGDRTTIVLTEPGTIAVAEVARPDDVLNLEVVATEGDDQASTK